MCDTEIRHRPHSRKRMLQSSRSFNRLLLSVAPISLAKAPPCLRRIGQAGGGSILANLSGGLIGAMAAMVQCDTSFQFFASFDQIAKKKQTATLQPMADDS